MKKILLALLVLLMLAGCSSNADTPNTDDENANVKLEGLELQFVPSKDADVIIAGTEGLPELLAAALLEEGYEVYVIKDACASRNKYEFKQGIEAMQQNGVKVSCVEIALFEWLKGAKNPKFKEVQALIK